MTSRSKPSNNSTSATNVRRNLFHHHLSRRPTSASTSTSATTLQASPEEDTTDIVIRDKNGNYQVEFPVVPAVGEEQGPEDEAKEKERIEAKLVELYRNRSRQPSEPAGKRSDALITFEGFLLRIGAELLAAVQASLRNKVASLEEDNWMFEAEQEAPG
ncbi:MAG: hypothetical protein M1830_003423 [Pleopsidium flavum]|nr:MAG: hypothetical protein M1830_003423 [Pleopsidium flavum]